jgi:hypothetical protein
MRSVPGTGRRVVIVWADQIWRRDWGCLEGVWLCMVFAL